MEAIINDSNYYPIRCTWQETSVQVQSKVTMLSRPRRRRTVGQFMRISQLTLLLLCTGSSIMIRVSASTYQTQSTSSNEAHIEEGYYETLVVQQRSDAIPRNDDKSPNLIIIYKQQQQRSETVPYNSEARRTQVNAACSANPECAAAGLVDDCCPTKNGTFLLCCPQTSPPPEPTPTNVPIVLPTNPPVLPTNTPISPTDRPTATPIQIPVPTNFPTIRPARPPTLLPTQMIITTSTPTSAPVVSPTTELPITAVPTTLPPISTVTPAPSNVASPTLKPQSFTPTASPSSSTPNTTAVPSSQTTIVVSDSAAPSHAPSTFFQYPVTTLSVVDVQLTLYSDSSATRRKLQTTDSETDCTQILQNLLVVRMEKEVDSIINVYESLYIEIQNFTAPFTNSSIQSYIYDVLMNIRSPMEEHDANRYVEGSLLSQVQKNLFVEELQATDCSEFQEVSNVDIAVPRTVEEKSPNDTSSSKVSMGVVAGIIAGCATLMMIIGAIFIGSRLHKRNQLIDDDSSPAASVSKRPIRDSEEYDMSLMDRIEISTLGDPVISEHGKKTDVEDSTIGSTNIEYDYRKAYGDVHSITDSQLAESSDGSSPHRRSHRFGSLNDPSLQNSGGVAGGSNSDIVTAAGDTTIGSPFYISEEQFDVVAPAGLLGLILETSIEDGRPMVFSIRPSSSLAHILKVGDRLIAVDGIDVSKIRASDVSRMIAEMKDRERQLVFCRLVKGNVIPNKRY